MVTYALADGMFSTPDGNPLVMRYRIDTNDWNTINASATEDEYGLRGVRVTGHAVDVGGYLGSVGISLALDNPDLRVTIVEPVPDNLELIRWAVAANGVGDRVTVVAGAVGDGGPVSIWYRYTGTVALEHHAFVGNSTLAYDYGGEAPHEEVTYTSLRLADLGPVDWLKIDTEGAEWAFLDDPDVLSVPYLVGEWHPVRGHVRADLLGLLSASHVVTFSGPLEGPGGFVAVRR